MGMNWLITGGCGFIGTSLIKRLVEEGSNTVRVLDNLSVGSREDLGLVCEFNEVDASLFPMTPPASVSNVELVVGDILDEALATKVAVGSDIIVHLAANTGVGPSVKDPRGDMMANVVGTFNLLESARVNKVKKFIFASSGAPVGECTPPIHEELAPHPVSPYGASKLSGEGYCSAFYRTFGLRTVMLRFGNVYGPGSSHKSSLVAKFIKQAMEGKICEIYGDGTQTRDFIYIQDLVEAILRTSSADIGGKIFQIATNKEHTVTEVAEIIRKKLFEFGIEMKIEYGESRLGDVKRNYSDTSRAKRLLSWQSEIGLEGGIEKTVKWFISP